MSTDLVQVQPATPQVPLAGVGINTESKLFKLKPATLVINQKQTQADDATPGLFRVVETGAEYAEMRVALLFTPTESRACHIGKGAMNRVKENLICFSNDMIRPSDKAKDPQAPVCDGCPQADWQAWRDYKDKTGQSNKDLIPHCEVTWKAFLVDQKFKVPMKMYLRGDNAKNFVAAMNKMSWTFETIRNMEEREPSIFEVSFIMKTKAEKKEVEGKQVTIWYLDIPAKSFEIISKEDFQKFGVVYTKLVNSFAQDAVEKATEKPLQNKINDDINDAISEPEGISGDDETIVI